MTSDSTSNRVRDYIFRDLANIALDSRSSGLGVLPGQTGSGKTYAAASVACAVALQDKAPLLCGKLKLDAGGKLPERLIYVTPLKKNRDAFIQEIEKVAAGQGLDVDAVLDQVYLVESAGDAALSSLTAELQEHWPEDEDIMVAKRAFDSAVMIHNQVVEFAEKNPGETKLLAKLKEDSDEELRDAERRLRRKVKAFCYNEYRLATKGHQSECRSEEFFGQDAFDWVREAWPSTATLSKRVFVMTPEKFMANHDTVLYGSFTWMTAKAKGQILDGAMVIVDESDTVYDRILGKLIDQAVRGRVDPIAHVQGLAHVAANGFDGRDRRLVDAPGSAFGRFMESCEQARRCYDEYRFGSNFKLSDKLSGKKVQLFSDGISAEVRVDGARYGLTVDMDDHLGKNLIVYPKKDDSGGEGSDKVLRLADVLKAARGVYLFSTGAVHDVGVNFQSLENSLLNKLASKEGSGKQRRTVSTVTLEEAQKSVVAELQLPEQERWFESIMQMAQGRRRSKWLGDSEAAFQAKAGLGFLGREDMSIYSRGVSFVNLIESKEKLTLTEFEDIEFLTTPEAAIVSLADCCKVVLVSATAALQQLHNFDLDYIGAAVDDFYGDAACGDDVLLANRSEKEADRAAYGIEVALYADKDALDPSAWVEEIIAKKFAGVDKLKLTRAAEAAIKCGYSALGGSDYASFAANREMKVFSFVLDCLSRDIKSALIFNTASATDRLNFNRKRLVGLCEPLFAAIGENAQESMVFLDSANWEREFNAVKEALCEGERRLVVLSYNTAGAGLNPQYPIGVPDSARVKALSGRGAGLDKDFEAVYLGCPTNLCVHSFDEDLAKDHDAALAALLTGIWEQGVVYERGEISYGIMTGNRFRLASAYASRYRSKIGKGYRSGIGKDMKLLPSVRGTATKIVNQAVGRITRTCMKTDQVFIGVDAGLVDVVDLGATEDMPTSLEYDAVVDALRKQGAGRAVTQPELRAQKVNRAAVQCEYRQSYRKSTAWKPSEIYNRQKQWESYLRFPTAADDEFAALPNFIRRQCYIELPEPSDSYWFKIDDDSRNSWRDCEFGFGPANPFGTKGSRLDEGMTRLPELMRSRIVKDYFVAHGYATSWKPGRWMIPAGMVHNAYMGALGEAAAKAWLERCAGLVEGEDFRDMPQGLFEMFDVYLPGFSEPIFIDAKNWHESTPTAEGYIEKVNGKLDACCEHLGVESGYVIFMLACGRDEAHAGIREVDGGQGRILEIPGLFDPDTGEPNAEAVIGLNRFLASLNKKED